MIEHSYYVSAYRVLYSDDGQRWTVYREPGVDQDKVRRSCNVKCHVVSLYSLLVVFGTACYCLPSVSKQA